MNAFASASTAPVAFGQRHVAAASEHEIAILETARLYLAAIERSTSGAEAGQRADQFFSPDVEQIEYPNRFVPDGSSRSDGLVRGRAKGSVGIPIEKLGIAT